ncbi:MAG TPA: PIN domain-containing protein [Thermoanaerobaculia bacterium]|nr:PIN domain-containing protein [Thermoanaerobaculia bacterium]
MELLTELGQGPVGLDSSIFIYLIEEHGVYLPVVEPVFSAISAGNLTAVTSSLTLLEVLVQPLRAKLPELAEKYEKILTQSSGVRMIPLDVRILRAAAQLRAVTAMKTPDAIQLASALAAGCTAFLTNDRRIPTVSGLPILRAQDYLHRA